MLEILLTSIVLSVSSVKLYPVIPRQVLMELLASQVQIDFSSQVQKKINDMRAKKKTIEHAFIAENGDILYNIVVNKEVSFLHNYCDGSLYDKQPTHDGRTLQSYNLLFETQTDDSLLQCYKAEGTHKCYSWSRTPSEYTEEFIGDYLYIGIEVTRARGIYVPATKYATEKEQKGHIWTFELYKNNNPSDESDHLSVCMVPWNIPKTFVTTKENWIRNARGRQMIELDDRMLVFFQEKEENNDEMRTMVAHICKNDEGKGDEKKIFMTFMKIQMNCSKIYTLLIDVQLVNISGKDVLVAIYQASAHSLPGSAVCLFEVSEVLNSFGSAPEESYFRKAYDYCSDSESAKNKQLRDFSEEATYLVNDRPVSPVATWEHFSHGWAEKDVITALQLGSKIKVPGYDLQHVILGTSSGLLIRLLMHSDNGVKKLDAKFSLISVENRETFQGCDEESCGEIKQLLVDNKRRKIHIFFDGYATSVNLFHCESVECEDICLRTNEFVCEWKEGKCSYTNGRKSFRNFQTSPISVPDSCAKTDFVFVGSSSTENIITSTVGSTTQTTSLKDSTISGQLRNLTTVKGDFEDTLGGSMSLLVSDKWSISEYKIIIISIPVMLLCLLCIVVGIVLERKCKVSSGPSIEENPPEIESLDKNRDALYEKHFGKRHESSSTSTTHKPLLSSSSDSTATRTGEFTYTAGRYPEFRNHLQPNLGPQMSYNTTGRINSPPTYYQVLTHAGGSLTRKPQSKLQRRSIS